MSKDNISANLGKRFMTGDSKYNTFEEYIKDNPYNYSNCSCKYLCFECSCWKPITVINLKRDDSK